MIFRNLLAFAVAIAMAVPALAQDAAPEPSPIEHFTLDNGLEVVVIPDHRAPIVTHMVWYKIGSADEAPGKSGIAHFFEHLMFKGTAKHPGGELDRVVYELGGTGNAFTSYDYTAYYQIVPPEALATMMDFEADRMRGLILSEDVIGAERDVVLEERRLRIEGSPQALLGEETSATLYQNHPYRIPTIGWMHEMEQLNRDDAVAFYDQYYAPNNAILVVAGDVDPAEVRTLAEASYGIVPRGPDLPPRIRPSEPRAQYRAHGDPVRSPRRRAQLHHAPGSSPPIAMPNPARPRRLTCLSRNPRRRPAQPASTRSSSSNRHRQLCRRRL